MTLSRSSSKPLTLVQKHCTMEKSHYVCLFNHPQAHNFSIIYYQLHFYWERIWTELSFNFQILFLVFLCCSKLPSWARAVVPKIFYVTEKAWNYYPFTITGKTSIKVYIHVNTESSLTSYCPKFSMCSQVLVDNSPEFFICLTQKRTLYFEECSWWAQQPLKSMPALLKNKQFLISICSTDLCVHLGVMCYISAVTGSFSSLMVAGSVQLEVLFFYYL